MPATLEQDKTDRRQKDKGATDGLDLSPGGGNDANLKPSPAASKDELRSENAQKGGDNISIGRATPLKVDSATLTSGQVFEVRANGGTVSIPATSLEQVGATRHLAEKPDNSSLNGGPHSKVQRN